MNTYRGLATFSPDHRPTAREWLSIISAYLACVVLLPLFFVEEGLR